MKTDLNAMYAAMFNDCPKVPRHDAKQHGLLVSELATLYEVKPSHAQRMAAGMVDCGKWVRVRVKSPAGKLSFAYKPKGKK